MNVGKDGLEPNKETFFVNALTELIQRTEALGTKVVPTDVIKQILEQAEKYHGPTPPVKRPDKQ